MMKPFFIWQDKTLKRINPLEVVCLITEDNYTRICFPDKTNYIARSTLSGILEKLPADIFIRVRRSFAVSVFYIDDIGKDHLIIGDTPIPIARQYYDHLLNQLQIIR